LSRLHRKPEKIAQADGIACHRQYQTNSAAPLLALFHRTFL
jgi:hypothetical protein